MRIGDFGLARPGDYRTPVSNPRTATREVFGSFTKDVGTASYVAPEVRSAGNGKYNEKADVSSFVIFEQKPFACQGLPQISTSSWGHSLGFSYKNPDSIATIYHFNAGGHQEFGLPQILS